MTVIRRFIKSSFLFLVGVGVLYAARPMNTDDGRIVDTNSCQLESWIKHGQDSEFWAMPACNFLLDSEITLGGNITRESQMDTKAYMVLALKKIFFDLENDGFSYGFALGNVQKNLKDNDSVYGYLLFSKAYRENRLFLHSNLGVRAQVLPTQRATTRSKIYNLGLGIEYDVNEYIWLMAETFYESSLPTPAYQLGIRIWLARDMLQIDCTYGNDFLTPFNANNSFVSLGLRVLSQQLF